MKEKPKRDSTNWKPSRMLGRVDEETWKKLQQAAKREEKTFTQWAVEQLLAAAEK